MENDIRGLITELLEDVTDIGLLDLVWRLLLDSVNDSETDLK